MARIPSIAYEKVRPLVRECIHRSRGIVQADLYALTWEGRAAVLKDFSGRPLWVRATWGRIVTGREFRALRRLRGVEGIPELLAEVGPLALLMERLEADRLPRNRDAPPGPEYFGRVSRLVATLHEQGISHGDLRRKNILIDDQERPYLIDFATSVTAKPGLSGIASRFYFRRAAAVDRTKLARIKRDFYPEGLNEEELETLRRQPWYLHAGRFFKKKVYRLKKPHHRRRLFKRLRQWLTRSP